MAWLRQQSAPTTAGRAPLGPGVHRGFDSLSHLAVWPALYVVSSIPCLMQVAGMRPLPGLLAPVLGIALLTGIATYLLDRAKLGGRWLDPADDAAHAARHAFITRHAGAIRLFIAASLCLATILAWRLPIASHWPAALPAASSLGVLVYASRPRSARPRPKDLLALKNLYVACGITGFALLLVAASMGLDAQDLLKALGQRLPPSLLNRPKQGFGVPLSSWFRGPLRPMLWDVLTSQRFLSRDFVHPDFLRHLLREHDEQRRDNQHWLWSLLMLELWLRDTEEHTR